MGVGAGVGVELVQAGEISNERSRADAICEEEVMGLILHTFACACMTQQIFTHLRGATAGKGLLPLPSAEQYNNGLRKHDR